MLWWKDGTTVREAREYLSRFLKETGCYDICAHCPGYPDGEGCCTGCEQLTRDEAGQVTGCGSPNLSCLGYTCAVLNKHLDNQGRLTDLLDLVYGMPREGYRGCQRRGDGEVMQITDPLAEVTAKIRILSGSVKEETGE